MLQHSMATLGSLLWCVFFMTVIDLSSVKSLLNLALLLIDTRNAVHMYGCAQK